MSIFLHFIDILVYQNKFCFLIFADIRFLGSQVSSAASVLIFPVMMEILLIVIGSYFGKICLIAHLFFLTLNYFLTPLLKYTKSFTSLILFLNCTISIRSKFCIFYLIYRVPFPVLAFAFCFSHSFIFF